MTELFRTVVNKVAASSSKDVLWSMFAFTAFAVSWTGYLVSSYLARRHEGRMRELRREDRSLDVVFFDVTQRVEAGKEPGTATLRSQPLASVKFDDSWDIAQRKLIETWDSRDRGAIVRPASDVDAAALADRIYTLACCTLSATIPAIRSYIQDDQIADERDGFKHVRFLACLARPHASAISWKDTPRLVIVPVGTARRLVALTDSEIVCKHSPKNRETWLGLLRELGVAWRDQDHPLYERAIATLDIGISPACGSHCDQVAAVGVEVLC
ncbi:hypothetical protein OAH18_02070 [bacterium]|nr:hypothetical protein [bacterium]